MIITGYTTHQSGEPISTPRLRQLTCRTRSHQTHSSLLFCNFSHLLFPVPRALHITGQDSLESFFYSPHLPTPSSTTHHSPSTYESDALRLMFIPPWCLGLLLSPHAFINCAINSQCRLLALSARAPSRIQIPPWPHCLRN